MDGYGGSRKCWVDGTIMKMKDDDVVMVDAIVVYLIFISPRVWLLL